MRTQCARRSVVAVVAVPTVLLTAVAATAFWRTAGIGGGSSRAASSWTEIGGASANSATKLRFSACGSDGSKVIGRNGSFLTSVQLLNASNQLVSDNTNAQTIALIVTAGTAKSPWSPSSLTVPASSSSTSATASITGLDNNGWTSFTVTASTSGLTSATCILKRQ